MLGMQVQGKRAKVMILYTKRCLISKRTNIVLIFATATGAYRSWILLTFKVESTPIFFSFFTGAIFSFLHTLLYSTPPRVRWLKKRLAGGGGGMGS